MQEIQKKLSSWAKENDLTYMQAYRKFQRGEINNARKIGGSIYVIRENEDGSVSMRKDTGEQKRPSLPGSAMPVSAASDDKKMGKRAKRALARFHDSDSGGKSRYNLISTEEEDFDSKYGNIDNSMVPFSYETDSYGGTSCVTVKDAVELTQKAYYNFSIFRNTIDLMTEFSTGDIYLKGGSKRAKEFYKAYFNIINLNQVQDIFFREYYRSGNVFFWKFTYNVTADNVFKMQKFVTEMKRMTVGQSELNSPKIALKYILLNPSDVILDGSSSFDESGFEKELNYYEIERLRNPRTEQDKQLFDSLDPETKKSIKDKNRKRITIDLDPSKLIAIFYKKQPYEPFAVPMGFPVLEDLNWKYELKKLDKMTSRTMNQAILLVTMGNEPDKGGVDQQNILAMQDLFTNESVSRTIIADYTTKAQFIIPQIADILDPKKYEVVDRDIKEGLNNILLGGTEKFANQSVKTQIFLERLKQGRDQFLREFLIPEMKHVARIFGFKNIPEPKFSDLDFKDPVQEKRVILRLMELGLLTPEEGMRAMETAQLPTNEESIESQEEFKQNRERGYYAPLVGGAAMPITKDEHMELNKPKPPASGAPKSNGRPSGSGGDSQSVPRSPRVQGSEDYFSLSKITENMKLASELKSHLKKVAKNIDLEMLTDVIVANCDPHEWIEKSSQYIESPVDDNPKRVDQILNIACEHGISTYLASILYVSKK